MVMVIVMVMVIAIVIVIVIVIVILHRYQHCMTSLPCFSLQKHLTWST